MLLQSYDDVLTLLPALPSAWTEGSIRGLKAQGDFTVDISWSGLQPVTATIVSNKGAALRVRCLRSARGLDAVRFSVNGKEVKVTLDNQVATVPCTQGDVVTIDFNELPTGVKVCGTVPVSPVDEAVYDLSGRVIPAARFSFHRDSLPAGIYIVEGKKVRK